MKSNKTKETDKEVKQKSVKVRSNNIMRKVKLEKVVLSAGATGQELQKSKKLLEIITSSKAQVIASSKRIPDFDVRPGLEVGTRVTLRKKKAFDVLKRLLGAIDNKLKLKQISENHFSFGIEEYIEIPGMEYQRDIGIKGLNITVVFTRHGARIKMKKIKFAKLPKKQHISKEEIINYMEEVFKTKFD